MAAEPAHAPQPKTRVLIVDDEPNIRAFLDTLLVEEGFETRQAGNGREALDAILEFHPDVILLDLFMPVMDGRTFVAVYRSRPAPHAPIVAISASSKVLGLDAKLPEVEVHLDKPFEIDELLSAIRQLTGRDGTAAAPGGAGGGDR